MKFIAGILLWAMFLPFSWADYPQRPVELIVGLAPGGSSDILARALAKSLEPILKQPVVVKNVVGAGGTIAIKNTINASEKVV